ETASNRSPVRVFMWGSLQLTLLYSISASTPCEVPSSNSARIALPFPWRASAARSNSMVPAHRIIIMKFAARARQLEFKPLDRVFDRVIVCFCGKPLPHGRGSVRSRERQRADSRVAPNLAVGELAGARAARASRCRHLCGFSDYEAGSVRTPCPEAPPVEWRRLRAMPCLVPRRTVSTRANHFVSVFSLPANRNCAEAARALACRNARHTLRQAEALLPADERGAAGCQHRAGCGQALDRHQRISLPVVDVRPGPNGLQLQPSDAVPRPCGLCAEAEEHSEPLPWRGVVCGWSTRYHVLPVVHSAEVGTVRHA